jgi:hypothetical protein
MKIDLSIYFTGVVNHDAIGKTMDFQAGYQEALALIDFVIIDEKIQQLILTPLENVDRIP